MVECLIVLVYSARRKSTFSDRRIIARSRPVKKVLTFQTYFNTMDDREHSLLYVSTSRVESENNVENFKNESILPFNAVLLLPACHLIQSSPVLATPGTSSPLSPLVTFLPIHPSDKPHCSIILIEASWIKLSLHCKSLSSSLLLLPLTGICCGRLSRSRGQSFTSCRLLHFKALHFEYNFQPLHALT